MTRHPHRRTDRSIALRAIALAGTFALIGAACASDDPEANDATKVSATPTTDDETAAAEPLATDVSVDIDNSTTEVEPEAMTGGEIEMTASIDFETGQGTWQVTSGADTLGCASGTFVEGGFAAGVERTARCDDGPSTGSIVFRFAPEPVDDEPNDLTSDWTVHDATGDFAGLNGGGDWTASIRDDESGADEVWTGSIEFGTAPSEPGETEQPDADMADGELSTAFLNGVIERLDVPDDADGAVMVSIIDSSGDSITAADGSSPDGALPGPSDPVRVGSISKVFVALATLSLVDDGIVGLDDLASEYVNRASVPGGVTVRDLLQHTSGIPDYVAIDGFFDSVLDDRSRVWTPEESIALVDEDDVEPGTEFSYSSTNYLLLGLLLEDVTGRAAHEVVRERVLEVADMTDTYLAGAEPGAIPVPAFENLPGRSAVLTTSVDYTSIATSAWVAGAMVSTGDDLHRLFRALVAGEVISDESFAEMIANQEYGLGIESWDEDDSLIGHGGSIPGYNTLVFHDPESGQTAFFVSTNDRLTWGPIVEDTVSAIVPDLAGDAS